MANINGTDNGETLTGTPDADIIDGKGGNDTIRALASADLIIGGPGNDQMYGGTGNDIYQVDNVADRSIELANQGTDEVRLESQIYFLDANVENITVLYAGGADVSGNEIANVIRGGAGNDELHGNGGIDTILGNGGDDFIDGSGLLRGGIGRDTLTAFGANDDNLYGDGGNDYLDAGGGADRTYGGSGNDVIDGGEGNDRAYGEAGQDQIFAGAGNDLAYGGDGDDSIEGEAGNDQLFGDAGNDTLGDRSGDNKLYGGDGNDFLIGTGGNNAMYGGKGQDDYFVDNIQDAVHENGREGTDEVATTLNSYTIGANLENLRFVGSGHFFGTGSALANLIAGGDGNDVLRGNGGSDRLIGGLGVDTAVYAGKASDYEVTTTPAGITLVTDLNLADGNDSNDTLSGVELLQFSDKTVSLSAGPPALMQLSAILLSGANYGDQAGNAVSAGDVNGDGFDDLLIGAEGFDPDGPAYPDIVEASAGGAYIVYGDPDNWPFAANLRDLNTGGDLAGEIRGFRLDGFDEGQAAAGSVANGDRAGHAVAAAGDVNGDGFADFIVGAPSTRYENYEGGEAYLIFGKAGGWPDAQRLVELDGTDGVRLQGDSFQQLGMDVAAAGDINGDGFGDVVVTGGGSRDAYVVFGHAGAWAGTIDVNALDGADGFRIEGAGSVAEAGDINGDGIDDVIVGAADGTTGHVIYGRETPWAASYVLAEMEGTTVAPGNLTGIGDVNNDGFDDLAATDPTADPHGIVDAGSVFVIFGDDSLVDTTVDVDSLNGGNGFRLDGASLAGGLTVAAAGDVNGDGIEDFLVNADETYVIYGNVDGWGAFFELGEINGVNGFAIDNKGAIARSFGDFNDDGFSDIVFGNTGTTSSDPGWSQVFYGGDFAGGATTV